MPLIGKNLRMAIIRPIGIPISTAFYNSQEIGLARGLAKCGVSVDVYVASSAKQTRCSEVASVGSAKVRLFELPFLKLPLIDHALYPDLRKLLREGRYDFLQVNEENELTSFWVARYGKQMAIPVVVYQGMYMPLTGRIYRAFQNFYDRALLPLFKANVDLALVKTSRAGRHLQKKGFQQIKLLPVGLDPSPFGTPKDRNWRAEFDIPQDSRIVLYVGVFEVRRNVDFMLDLAQILSADGVTLVMAGVGPEHARINARIAEEKLSNIRLVGMVSQEAMSSLYRAASLFLLPSNYEIYGMVVLEAMYFGLPVISTCSAGPEDIIHNDVDGVLIDSLETGKWVSTIRDLFLQPERLQEMAARAQSKIHSKLLWDVIAKEYFEQVIIRLLTPGPAALNRDDGSLL